MLSKQEIIENTEKYSVHNYDRYPFAFERANGVWVWDVEGRKYMDMLCTYGANSLGHNNPRIKSSLIEYLQSDLITSMSGGFYNPPYSQLVKALAKFSGFERVLLKTGGSEAVEAACKLAKRWGYQVKRISRYQNVEVIGCTGNFHGRLPTALALSTVEKHKRDFKPFPPGIYNVPFGDPYALERAITPFTAGFIFEVIQGEGGINLWPKDVLREVQNICRKHNVLMIADEIQTGLGRTGANFAYEYDAIRPDIVILGKTLGGGLFPISAVLADDNIAGPDRIGPGDEGSTFGNHPLSCVAALRVLELLQKDNLAAHSAGLGIYFRDMLRKLESPWIKEIRGRGLMVGIELVPGAPKSKHFIGKLLEEGIICEKSGHDKDVIRFTPPLNIAREEINWALTRIGKVFKSEGGL
jgi:ornithine--oxo-acid transaminase